MLSEAKPSVRERTPDPSAPCLLVAFDGTQPARAALTWALARAGHHGRVVVAHVSELPADFAGTPTYAQVREQQRRRAQELLHEAVPHMADGPTVQTRLLVGPTAKALSEAATGLEASEVVAGTSGRSRLPASIGSVCHGLLRRLNRPLVAVPPQAVPAVVAERVSRRIVVATAPETEQSWVAAAAARVARDTGSEVMVVCVDERVPAVLGALSPAEEVARARMGADRVVDQLRALGLHASAHVRFGDPLPEIEAFCAEQAADLVAVSARRRAGRLQPPLGSVPSGLLTRSRVPVLVVPPTSMP
jgi:nucleotide-binding universal stress UspA family protein